MLSKYTSGDVNILTFNIRSLKSGGTVSLEDRNLYTTFSIFEDMFRPYIYAEVVIQDAQDLLSGLPITGEEVIELEFASGGVNEISPARYVLYVYQVVAVSKSDTGQSQSYILKCVSVEKLINETFTVSKGYEAPITEMVNDILRSALGTGKRLEMDPTKGVQEILIPSLAPFAAIDYLRQKAVSGQAASSFFVFFENQHGYVFKTIENLIRERPVGGNMYRFDGSVNDGNDANDFLRLIAFQQNTRVNSIEKLGDGVLRSSILAFDIITKNLVPVDFKSSETGLRFFSVPNESSMQFSPTFLQNLGTASVRPQPKVVAFDAAKSDTFVFESSSFKQAYRTLIKQNQVSGLAHGNHSLAAGKSIYIRVGQTHGGLKVEAPDKYIEGQYLLKSVRHFVEVAGKPIYRTSFEAIRAG